MNLPGRNIIDADCEQFKFRNVAAGELHSRPEGKTFERDENYPENYLAFITSVEADAVLLNCHISLLEQLDKEDVLLVYPSSTLIPEYLQRYRNRGDQSSFISYMEDEAEGMLMHIESSNFEKYRVAESKTYLSNLFERNDFKVKVMTRAELGDHLQRAMDLGVIRDELHTDGPSKLVCDVKFAHEPKEHPLKNGRAWAEAVLDGKYELDIDQLVMACQMLEAELKAQRETLISHFQRAIDLDVLDTDKVHGAIVCDLSFVNDGISSADIHDAYVLADAVMNGVYEVDIDYLQDVCKQREQQIEEMKFAELRGGLSREELADKIMQGIVNGALGIRYAEIAPYSHGYEVTFGGDGPAGSTRDFKNRWECYCDFFQIPAEIVSRIENGRQSNQTFGKKAEPLDVFKMLQAINEMETKQITTFIPEKETTFERHGARGYGSRGSIASVMDVHAGKGFDGIVQHHYHGDYSSMTPSRQNDLVETLVFMKGFCLDMLNNMPGGRAAQEKVVDYLAKHGTDISTPEMLRVWTRENPEKCGYLNNRNYYVLNEKDKSFYQHAFCDFVQLKALADKHTGSLESFVKKEELLGMENFDGGSFECAYGVIYTYISENEDGSLHVADDYIEIWDCDRDVFLAEGVTFEEVKEMCQKNGMDLIELEAKAIAELSDNQADLEEQIQRAEASREKVDRASQGKDLDKER